MPPRGELVKGYQFAPAIIISRPKIYLKQDKLYCGVKVSVKKMVVCYFAAALLCMGTANKKQRIFFAIPQNFREYMVIGVKLNHQNNNLTNLKILITIPVGSRLITSRH